MFRTYIFFFKNKNSPKKNILSQIEIFIKNRHLILKVYSQINILRKKSPFWAKIEILGKNRNFGRKSKFWSKINISVHL